MVNISRALLEHNTRQVATANPEPSMTHSFQGLTEENPDLKQVGVIVIDKMIDRAIGIYREDWLKNYQPVTSLSASPISARLLTVRTPAASSAANFSSAVPLPPEMIAPACPIRLPGGAVTPAI